MAAKKKPDVTTVLEVVQLTNGHKAWRVIRADDMPEVEGQVTACGVPERAAHLPLGSRYTSTLTLGDE
jgi:hypothetical protein